MTDQQLETLKRCEDLLDAVVRFIQNNPILEEYYVHYDKADCDGACLRDDCGIALDQVRFALKQEQRS